MTIFLISLCSVTTFISVQTCINFSPWSCVDDGRVGPQHLNQSQVMWVTLIISSQCDVLLGNFGSWDPFMWMPHDTHHPSKTLLWTKYNKTALPNARGSPSSSMHFQAWQKLLRNRLRSVTKNPRHWLGLQLLGYYFADIWQKLSLQLITSLQMCCVIYISKIQPF